MERGFEFPILDSIKALEFIFDFRAPGMVVPFLVGVFWYDRSRVYAVVASMTAGTLATVVWRFVLGSPWQLRPRPVRVRGCSGRAVDRPAGDLAMGTESAL